MKVCVVIPAYNAAGYIVEALDSVAGQGAPPDQVVVVDDGSRDDTARVVRDWIAAHPACGTLLVEQANGGIPVARNAGADAGGVVRGNDHAHFHVGLRRWACAAARRRSGLSLIHI